MSKDLLIKSVYLRIENGVERLSIDAYTRDLEKYGTINKTVNVYVNPSIKGVGEIDTKMKIVSIEPALGKESSKKIVLEKEVEE